MYFKRSMNDFYLKFMSSTLCTTMLMNCMQATMNSIWKDSGSEKKCIRVENLEKKNQFNR